MPEERTGSLREPTEGQHTPSDTGPKQLSRVNHPLGPFLSELLILQCRCCRARQGAVLQVSTEGDHALLAVHPADGGEGELQQWLAPCATIAKKVLSSGAAVLSPLNGDATAHGVIVPLRLAGGEPIVTAVLLQPADRNAAEATRQLLELIAGVSA